MLKNDMRKYILGGKSFNEFMTDCGSSALSNYSYDVILKTWDKVQQYYISDVEWLKYLKNQASRSVKYLEDVVNALNEAGVPLNATKAGGELAAILRRQKNVFDNKIGKEEEKESEEDHDTLETN